MRKAYEKIQAEIEQEEAEDFIVPSAVTKTKMKEESFVDIGIFDANWRA